MRPSTWSGRPLPRRPTASTKPALGERARPATRPVGLSASMLKSPATTTALPGVVAGRRTPAAPRPGDDGAGPGRRATWRCRRGRSSPARRWVADHLEARRVRPRSSVDPEHALVGPGVGVEQAPPPLGDRRSRRLAHHRRPGAHGMARPLPAWGRRGPGPATTVRRCHRATTPSASTPGRRARTPRSGRRRRGGPDSQAPISVARRGHRGHRVEVSARARTGSGHPQQVGVQEAEPQACPPAADGTPPSAPLQRGSPTIRGHGRPLRRTPRHRPAVRPVLAAATWPRSPASPTRSRSKPAGS